MKRRQITLADGRYLIFYSFDEEKTQRVRLPVEEVKAKRAEPEAKPEAEEERDV